MNVMYPLGIISRHKVSPQSKVITDAFEDGSTMARALWAANNFKRQIQFEHAGLTLAEWRYLRSFYSQRTGQYDSFWYRDNVNRRGNVNVRFAGPVEDTNDGTVFTIPVKLAEIAPIRALPEWDELTAAAGNAPLFWYDANREFYLNHAGAVYKDSSVWDVVSASNIAPWTGAIDLSATILGQYQAYGFGGTNYALSSANAPGVVGTQPGFTLFVIVQSASNPSTKQVLLSLGAIGAGQALGIVMGADNTFQPWVGGSESWSSGIKAASVVNTWSSYAVVWSASANLATGYSNAALLGSDSHVRSYVAGPIAFGAASDGSLPANGAFIQHAMAFPAALSISQVKAIHNLLGYQYGLAIVP